MPSGKNTWLTFLTFDLLIKNVILHALLAATMTSILLVIITLTLYVSENQSLLFKNSLHNTCPF